MPVPYLVECHFLIHMLNGQVYWRALSRTIRTVKTLALLLKNLTEASWKGVAPPQCRGSNTLSWSPPFNRYFSSIEIHHAKQHMKCDILIE